MIDGVPETGKTVKISIGALIGLVVFAFVVGFEAAAIYGLSTKINDEVGGLRADWERDRNMQNARLDKLEIDGSD